MSSPVVFCSRFSDIRELDRNSLIVNRSGHLTPTQFKEHISKYPNYRLSDGGTDGMHALQWAAKDGNLKLVEHLIEKGGRDLIDLGDECGRTALFHACSIESKKTPRIVEKLIQLGANVNIATTSTEFLTHPRGSTPLWAALMKAKSVALAVLLLQHGALLSPDSMLSEKGKSIYEQAKAILADQSVEPGEAKIE